MNRNSKTPKLEKKGETATKKFIFFAFCRYCNYLWFPFEYIYIYIFSYSKLRTVEEILTIEIKPGWKKGTKITFPEKGNQEPGVIAADLIFIIDEKPHEVFTRDGNDLIINQEIPLLEALTGKTVELTTLDGRTIRIPVTEIVKPGYELTVPNEGMPVSKEPRKKGNLKIKFDVRYPTRLTSEQKLDLKRVLGGSL